MGSSGGAELARADSVAARSHVVAATPTPSAHVVGTNQNQPVVALLATTIVIHPLIVGHIGVTHSVTYLSSGVRGSEFHSLTASVLVFVPRDIGPSIPQPSQHTRYTL